MTKKKHVPQRFMVLARTEPGHYPHPVEVTLHLDGKDSIVGFSIGPHAVNVGGLVPLASVIDASAGELNPMFATEFDAAELHWMVPFLVRLHAGEDVKDEIVAAYRERHGERPGWMG